MATVADGRDPTDRDAALPRDEQRHLGVPMPGIA